MNRLLSALTISIILASSVSAIRHKHASLHVQEEPHDLKWATRALASHLVVADRAGLYDPIPRAGCQIGWTSKPTLIRTAGPRQSGTRTVNINLAAIEPNVHVTRVAGDRPVTLILFALIDSAITNDLSQGDKDGAEFTSQYLKSIAFQFAAQDADTADELAQVMSREIRRCSGVKDHLSGHLCESTFP